MSLAEVLGLDAKKVAPLVFHSRYRKFRKQLTAEDGKVYHAEFDNYMLVVQPTKKNEVLVSLLRDNVGSDYAEVDIQERAEREDARDKELVALQAKVAKLEAERDNLAPRVRMKAPKKAQEA